MSDIPRFIRDRNLVEILESAGFSTMQNVAANIDNIPFLRNIGKKKTAIVVGGVRAFLRQANRRPPAEDNVNHPAHYADGKIEHVEYMKDRGWLVHGCLYNASKYIHRCEKKGKMIEDIDKAVWYLTYLSQYLKEQNK